MRILRKLAKTKRRFARLHWRFDRYAMNDHFSKSSPAPNTSTQPQLTGQGQRPSKWAALTGVAIVVFASGSLFAQDVSDSDGDGIPNHVECPVALSTVTTGTNTTMINGEVSREGAQVINFSITGEYPLFRRSSSEGFQVIWNQEQAITNGWDLELSAPTTGALTEVVVAAGRPGVTTNLVNVRRDIAVTWDGGGSAVVSDPVNELINLNTGDTVQSGVVVQVDSGFRLPETQWSLTIDFTPVSTFPTTISFATEAFGNATFEGFGFSAITSCDSDGDGVPDLEDLDSDNDGIGDAIEGVIDTDGDGVPNYLDTDSDADGLFDLVEGADDTDSDGASNYVDTDSDDDGIADAIEGSTDADNDGTADYLDLDSDNDGIADSEESSGDSDGDSIPDFLDTDSDNDGLPDAQEGAVDTDNDGVPNYRDQDADNDGIPDLSEGDNDNDGDGLANYLDLDSDSDGIADLVEAGGSDTNADGQVDNYRDNNANGVDDGVDTLPLALSDTDSDGIEDYLDLDSDNDGIPDTRESANTLLDSNGDGLIDSTVDSNGDGWPDNVARSALIDTDNDGVYNHHDLDSDNDGASDLSEAGGTDADADGIVDGWADVDTDGIPDNVDADQLSASDADGDGVADFADVDFLFEDDSDADGIVDRFDLDPFNDGLARRPSGVPVIGAALPDTNGDGTPDVRQATVVVIGPENFLRTGLRGSGSTGPLGLVMLGLAGLLLVRKPREQIPVGRV